jgi:hypothetical protein
MPRRSQSPNKKPVVQKPAVQTPVINATAYRPSFLQTMKEGLAFGIGNSMAHRFMMGNALQQQKQEPEKLQTQKQEWNPEYIQCIQEHNDRIVCEEMYLKK